MPWALIRWCEASDPLRTVVSRGMIPGLIQVLGRTHRICLVPSTQAHNLRQRVAMTTNAAGEIESTFPRASSNMVRTLRADHRAPHEWLFDEVTPRCCEPQRAGPHARSLFTSFRDTAARSSRHPCTTRARAFFRGPNRMRPRDSPWRIRKLTYVLRCVRGPRPFLRHGRDDGRTLGAPLRRKLAGVHAADVRRSMASTSTLLRPRHHCL